MNKIKTIIGKEWGEVFKQRLVLFTTLFMPILFTVIAIGTLVGISGSVPDDSAVSGLSPEMMTGLCGVVTGALCFKLFLASQFLLFFMLIPVIIPITIASYSIVGEKNSRSLEPLLATPITTAELLIGKAIAAVLPAILATWLGFTAYLVGVWVLDKELLPLLLRPLWLLAIFGVGPLLALLSVNFAMMISSRVNDPRAAEQLSVIVVLPMIMLVVGQSLGLFVLDQTLIALFAGILLVLDIVLGYLAVKIFQRERILTKWK
jgi:ABC-2 type transport system permease protein